MDFRRLQHFLAVADHHGFTAASKAVFVSQPALSLAVKELEAELGAELFTRLGRSIRLTPAGEALLAPARQALRDLETGRAAVSAVTGLRAGRLSLGSLPTLAADPLAPIVGRFRQQHPAVTVDLAAPEGTAELLDLVGSATYELGLTEWEQLPGDLVAHHMGDQQLFLVFPPGTGGDGRPVALAGLGDVPFVAAPVGTSTRRLLDEGLAAAGRSPRVAVVAAQRDAILSLVLAGAGAALLPEATAAVAGRLGAEVARPDPPITRQVALVHRPGPLAPAAAAFLALALEPPRP